MKKYIEKKKDAKTALTMWWYVCLTDEDEIKIHYSLIRLSSTTQKKLKTACQFFSFWKCWCFAIVPLRLILNHRTTVVWAIPYSVQRDELLDCGRVHLCFGSFGSFITFWLLPNHNRDDEDVPHRGTGAIKSRYCITVLSPVQSAHVANQLFHAKWFHANDNMTTKMMDQTHFSMCLSFLLSHVEIHISSSCVCVTTSKNVNL